MRQPQPRAPSPRRTPRPRPVTGVVLGVTGPGANGLGGEPGLSDWGIGCRIAFVGCQAACSEVTPTAFGSCSGFNSRPTHAFHRSNIEGAVVTQKGPVARSRDRKKDREGPGTLPLGPGTCSSRWNVLLVSTWMDLPPQRCWASLLIDLTRPRTAVRRRRGAVRRARPVPELGIRSLWISLGVWRPP